MSLHNEIMNIPVTVALENVNYSYLIGHKDARHAAAELSLRYEDIIDELCEALKAVLEYGIDQNTNRGSWVVKKANDALSSIGELK